MNATDAVPTAPSRAALKDATGAGIRRSAAFTCGIGVHDPSGLRSVIQRLPSFLTKWGIYFTQVAPISCGRPAASAKHFTIDLYGTGATATACSARRRKSLPLLREFRNSVD